MSWLDGLRAFVNAVDTEYDRRIRTASNVKEYHIGGHGSHGHHDSHDDGADNHTHAAEVERLEGEGGALGELQANAGPHLGHTE